MKDILVENILEVANGELITGNKEMVCDNFSKDTRTMKKGDTYIGIKGETFDGNKFWKQALEQGADCVIVENIEFEKEDINKYSGKTIIKVDDTIKALGEIAKFKRSMYNIPVVGITGSVGKTSTKDIVANVVSQKYKTLKTIGNNNNHIGLPFTILNLRDHEALVIEMGMNHLGEISYLTSIAKPTICVITNIGTAHIGLLGSRENILKAKLEILEGTENPIVIINNDNDLLHNWYQENKEKINIKTYAINENSDLNAKNVILNKEDIEFKCNIQNEETTINVPVGGEHFVLNALCAVMVGETLNIEKEHIIEGIRTFELTKKRMEISKLNSGIEIINDAYNAGPEAVKASLKYLAGFNGNRKIAVLGDMLELGEYSKQFHEDIGREVYKNNIDILICSGKEAKNITNSAQTEGMNKENIYYLENKDDILQLLKQISIRGDIILFKASKAMKFFDIAEDVKNTL